MNAVELMDSRKFMALMDVLIEVWRDPLQKDEPKAETLQAVLDFASGKATGPKVVITSKFEEDFGKQMGKNAAETLEALEPKPKRTRRAKAEMQAEAAPKGKGGRPKGSKNKPEKESISRAEARKKFDEHTSKITIKEREEFKRQDEANKPKDPILVIRKAIAEVIKPSWHQAAPNMAGFKVFRLKMVRNGENVSFNAENWVNAMKAEGLPVSQGQSGAAIHFRVLNTANAEIPDNNKNADAGSGWMEIQIG